MPILHYEYIRTYCSANLFPKVESLAKRVLKWRGTACDSPVLPEKPILPTCSIELIDGYVIDQE